MRSALLVRRSFRAGGLTLLTCALALARAEQGPAFFPVGIDYPPDARTPSSEIARDLQVIRSAGFNTIKTTIGWREGEPARGEYRFDALQRTLEVADRSGVRAILEIDRAAPAWVVARGAGGASPIDPSASKADDCGEPPSVRADRVRFVTMLARTAAKFTSLLAVDLGSPSPAGACSAELVAAVRAVVPAHVSLDRQSARIETSMPAAELARVLDGVAASSSGGWMLYVGAIPEPERRFAAWMAMARGAQGLIFDDPPQDTAFVRTITRNPALFRQVRPRPPAEAPRTLIDGGSNIEVRFLESAAVQMIVALNHSPAAQRVTMTFPPETQEAIWLNMETGSSVSFVAGPRGPLYQYWFRPGDVLVLMIRKDIR